MKKTLGLIILLANSSFKIYSQEEILFKVEYKPQTTYNQTVDQTSENEVLYLGSNEFLEKLKTKGLQNPAVTKSQSKTRNINKTGKTIKNKFFPLTIEFIESPLSKDKQGIPNGTIIYGKVPVGQSPILDSVHSPEMDIEFKKLLVPSMQSTMAQLTLPEKKLKVGESFTREIPLTIPVGNTNFNMTNTAVYKLNRIVDGLAYFDISQVYTLNSSETKMKATGKGNGQIIYDIKNTFYLKYQTETSMEMELDKESYSIKVKTKSNYIQNTTITSN